MSLSPKELDHLAQLAHLEITGQEATALQKSLDQIFSLVEKLNTIDTTVEPLIHPQDLPQPRRQDCVSEENEREHMQAIAPQIDDGLYLVPTVIDAPK